MSSGAFLAPFSLCSGVKMISTFLPPATNIIGVSLTLLRPLSDPSPKFGASKKSTYLCPQLAAPGSDGCYLALLQELHKMAFFSEKQSWPWWLMLIIQIVTAVVDFFTHNG